MNERKVVSFKEAKKRRRARKVAALPRAQPSPHRYKSWGWKLLQAVQVVLFLVILALFIKLCHGGSI